jgi:hypothetical protein
VHLPASAPSPLNLRAVRGSGGRVNVCGAREAILHVIAEMLDWVGRHAKRRVPESVAAAGDQWGRLRDRGAALGSLPG